MGLIIKGFLNKLPPAFFLILGGDNLPTQQDKPRYSMTRSKATHGRKHPGGTPQKAAIFQCFQWFCFLTTFFLGIIPTKGRNKNKSFRDGVNEFICVRFFLSTCFVCFWSKFSALVYLPKICLLKNKKQNLEAQCMAYLPTLWQFWW